eukprot:scaffold421228_cov49-Attheya_sp.AAC.3
MEEREWNRVVWSAAAEGYLTGCSKLAILLELCNSKEVKDLDVRASDAVPAPQERTNKSAIVSVYSADNNILKNHRQKPI